MEILLLTGKFPVGKSGAISKTGLALGFCRDSFNASPWGGEFTVSALKIKFLFSSLSFYSKKNLHQFAVHLQQQK